MWHRELLLSLKGVDGEPFEWQPGQWSSLVEFLLQLYYSLSLQYCATVGYSTIAVRRKSRSRRRRSQTSPWHLASRQFTLITTLWRQQPPPPPSQMALPFSPPPRWLENWHAHRPSVHLVHTMSCLSTSSLLSRRSTTSQMGWGTEVTGSAIAASSSRIWTCQCL